MGDGSSHSSNHDGQIRHTDTHYYHKEQAQYEGYPNDAQVKQRVKAKQSRAGRNTRTKAEEGVQQIEGHVNASDSTRVKTECDSKVEITRIEKIMGHASARRVNCGGGHTCGKTQSSEAVNT